ncbi:GDP-perosamine synthase [soil metagenome]
MKPFIPVCAPLLRAREVELVTRAVSEGWISSAGPFVQAFADRFADYVGSAFADPVANGTVGLHVVLHALGIGKGDEVIVPSQSFIATAAAVEYCGAKTIFADVVRSTWTIDPAHVARLLTPRTRAVIPVHLFGACADMHALRRVLAPRPDVFLLEDAAEAIGSSLDGVRVGALGDAAVFSFYGNKTITTGEGGMVTTSKKELFERVHFLKNHAMSAEKRYFHPEIGFNYRMTNMQAAIGLAQLECADDLVARKKRIAARYRAALGGLPGIHVQEIPANQDVAPWMFVLVDYALENEAARDAIIERIRTHGIETRPMFYPIHRMPAFASASAEQLPVTDDVSFRGLALPSGAGLTDDEIDRCIEAYVVERPK